MEHKGFEELRPTAAPSPTIEQMRLSRRHPDTAAEDWRMTAARWLAKLHRRRAEREARAPPRRSGALDRARHGVLLLAANAASGRSSTSRPALAASGMARGPARPARLHASHTGFEGLVLYLRLYAVVLACCAHCRRGALWLRSWPPRDPAARAAAALAGRARLPRLRPPRRPARPQPLQLHRRSAPRRDLPVRRLALPALPLWPAVHARELRARHRWAWPAAVDLKALAARRASPPSLSSHAQPAGSGTRAAGPQHSSA